jgi:hypothetical protein
MQGTRLPDGEWLTRAADGKLKPGEYGRCDAGWFVCCPNGSTTRLWVDEDDRNGNRHVITEHEDGTITVGGSILGRDVPSERIGGVGPITAEGYHGWLEHGVWRKC